MTIEDSFQGCKFEEKLSIDELCVAGACMGYLSAPDVCAKIISYPGKKLRTETIALLTAMENKGFVQSSFDKRPIVDKRIGQIAATVCNPERISCFKWWIAEGRSQKLTLYIRSGFCVVIDSDGRIFSVEDSSLFAESLYRLIDISGCEMYAVGSLTVLFDELKYAKKLADSFQYQRAEEFLSNCTESSTELQLLMQLVSGKTGYVIMSAWQKTKNAFTMESCDYVAVVDNQLIHIKNSLDGSTRLKGADPGRLKGRIKELCGVDK